ncbi:IS66 family insertion sequence element accessory protein TnpA [Ferrovum myxofaciens]|uniref:IS66 family insertion sequence element accessory protein TnpA n=1 Tax=Ferrovum myxofaciens TaxID=416213 RepID=UPI003EB957A1
METKRSRRIRHSRQDWQGFVSEFLTSGQDCKSFCRDKGLNPSRLIRWQGVFRNEISPAISQMQPVGFWIWVRCLPLNLNPGQESLNSNSIWVVGWY